MESRGIGPGVIRRVLDLVVALVTMALTLVSADKGSTGPIARQAALNAAAFRRERRFKAMNSSADARHSAPRAWKDILCGLQA